MKLRHGSVHDEPRGRGGDPEGPVGHRLGGHLAEPVVEHAERAGQRAEDRDLLGRVARHDLLVFLVGRLSSELHGQEADVVGDEAVHRRPLALGWSVVRRHHLGGVLESVRLVEDVEQLGVRVLVLLPRVGVGSVHVGGDPVGHRSPLGAVLGPRRDRVAQVLADDPLERGHLPGLIKAPEQVVERAVLEEDEHHMIHCVRGVRCRRHGPLSSRG